MLLLSLFTAEEFVIRHTSTKKCVSVDKDEMSLTLTSDCATKFKLTKEKAIQEVESEKCVLPQLLPNSRYKYDHLELQEMCDEEDAVVNQTRKFSIKQISSDSCWEFDKSTNVLVIKADNMLGDKLPNACDKDGTEFKFEKGNKTFVPIRSLYLERTSALNFKDAIAPRCGHSYVVLVYF